MIFGCRGTQRRVIILAELEHKRHSHTLRQYKQGLIQGSTNPAASQEPLQLHAIATIDHRRQAKQQPPPKPSLRTLPTQEQRQPTRFKSATRPDSPHPHRLTHQNQLNVSFPSLSKFGLSDTIPRNCFSFPVPSNGGYLTASNRSIHAGVHTTLRLCVKHSKLALPR